MSAANCSASEQIIPLTFSQKLAWKAKPIQSPPQNALACYTELACELDTNAFCTAIRQVLSESDTVMARCMLWGEEPVQVLRANVEMEDVEEPEVLDLCHETDPADKARNIMLSDLLSPSSTYRHLLLRVQQRPAKWFWYQRYLCTMLDGYSITRLSQRIGEVYAQGLKGVSPGCSPFCSVLTMVEEEHDYLVSDQCQDDYRFWRGYVKRLPKALTLSHQKKEPEGGEHQLIRYECSLDVNPETLEKLGLCESAYLPEWAMAATLAYLSRMTGLKHLCVGLPFMRRMEGAAPHVMAPMMSLLPLGVSLPESSSLIDILLILREELARIRPHQHYPADLIRDLSPQNRPLFSVVLNSQIFGDRLLVQRSECVTHHLAAGAVEDMEIGLKMANQQLHLELQASPEHYSKEEVRRHLSRLRAWFKTLFLAPRRPIQGLSLMDIKEIKQVASWSAGSRKLGLTTQMYVLDAFLNPTPPDAIGDLYVSSDELSVKYPNDPKEVASSFVANPFVEGGRMFRTGKRVRWRFDGQLIPANPTSQ